MKRMWIAAASLFITVCLIPFLFAQGGGGYQARRGTLTVIVDGFPNDQGSAQIDLCNSSEGFKNDDMVLGGEALPIKGGKARWVLKDLSWGKYALKVYHDENGNRKLDKSIFGVPKEAYGFSNNVRGSFGPPDYEKAVFQFDKKAMTVKITVK